MRPLALLILGGVAYAAFLLAGLPAAIVAPRLEAATGGRVVLERASGSVWNGTAAMRLALPWAGIVLEEVQWRFLPTRLATGRLAAHVTARAGRLVATAEVSRSPGAWQASGLRARGDASALALLVPLAAAWQPQGPLEIDAPHLAIEGGVLSGRASARWNDAALSLSTVRPLGDWRARLEAEGAPAKITLATVKGPLRLSGAGTFTPAGRLAFAGEARAEAGREADLAPLLQLLGPRRADGAHPLEVR